MPSPARYTLETTTTRLVMESSQPVDPQGDSELILATTRPRKECPRLVGISEEVVIRRKMIHGYLCCDGF
jgi:hypothetical protein